MNLLWIERVRSGPATSAPAGLAIELWPLSDEHQALSRRRRMAIALAIGLLTTAFSTVRLVMGGHGAWDFLWAMGGARDLLTGVEPYLDPHTGAFDQPLYYPLPALLLGIPFVLANIPQELAGGLFIGISSGLLAFGLTRRGLTPLLTFASYPYLWAASIGQWSPLILAAALIPELAPAFLGKPSLAPAVLVAFPNRKAFVLLLAGCVFVGILTIVWYPAWVAQWLANVQNGPYVAPILVFPGYVLLAALLHWRLPSGRLLFTLACTPQWLDFYDQLLLFLIPRSGRQFGYLVGASWICFFGWSLFPSGSPLHLDRYLWDIMLYMAALGLVIAQGHGWATRGPHGLLRIGPKQRGGTRK